MEKSVVMITVLCYALSIIIWITGLICRQRRTTYDPPRYLPQTALRRATLLTCIQVPVCAQTDAVEGTDYTVEGSTYTVYTAAGLLKWNEAARDNFEITVLYNIIEAV